MQANDDLSYEFENQSGASRRPLRTVRVPLVLRGEAIGEMELEMDRPEFSEEEGSYIENITTQTAIALENARLLQETERKAMQEQRLNEIASRFSRASSIDEILRAAAQEFGQLPSVSEVSVRLTPTDTQPPVHPVAAKNRNGSRHGLERTE
jgi:GAF domain-containing protein